MIIGISGKIGSGKDTVGRIIQYLTSTRHYEKTFAEWETISKDKERWYAGYSNWRIKKFAGKLKQIVSILTGIPVEDLEKQEVKDRVLGSEWNYFLDHKNKKHFNSPYPINDGSKTADKNILYSYKMTVRQMLQWVGTDAMRNVVHPNIWVNALISDYKEELDLEDSSLKFPNWIITDVRFPNELNAVKNNNGITIRVNRRCEVCKLTMYEKRGHNCNEITCPNGRSQHESETALDNAIYDFVINNDGSIEELINKVREILVSLKILK